MNAPRDPAAGSPFSPAVLGFLIATTVAIFALSVLLNAMEPGERTPYGAQTGSPSAIGHLGLYELLHRLDWPVSRSRIRDAARIDPGGVLILAEPDRKQISLKRDTALHDAKNVLLVLPKWSGVPDPFKDGWIDFALSVPEAQPRDLVRMFDANATIARVVPQRFGTNDLGVTPVTSRTLQLLQSKLLKPIIAGPDGMLLAEWRSAAGTRVWILADPDPLQNHGMRQPANVRFALALLEALRGKDGPIVFDEMVHGTVAPDRNPIQLLFTFPYSVVTIEVCVGFALLLLAFTGRFGGIERAPPALRSGKQQLIDNIADLMERAGHTGVILRRYITVRLAETGRGLHAPHGLSEPALAGWLDQMARARGTDDAATHVLSDADAAGDRGGESRLFGAARRLHAWGRKLLDGTR